MTTTGVEDTTCCYAEKTETRVNDPDGAPWEVYVKVADADRMTNSPRRDVGAGIAVGLVRFLHPDPSGDP